MSTAHPSDSRENAEPVESGRRSKDSDDTVALVCNHYFTPPADVGVSGGQCHHCGTSAWDVIERQQRKLEARDARIAVLTQVRRLIKECDDADLLPCEHPNRDDDWCGCLTCQLKKAAKS